MREFLLALDHVRVLGPTVEDIARNKAGIFKPGVPALVGPLTPGPLEVAKVILSV